MVTTRYLQILDKCKASLNVASNNITYLYNVLACN